MTSNSPWRTGIAGLAMVVLAGCAHGSDGLKLSAGDTDGLPFYTMPFVDGESLRARLARGPLTVTEVIGVLRDVSKALAYAHSHDVAHRDVRPGNVLLGPANEPYLAHLGIADVKGFLGGGMYAWQQAKFATESITQVSAEALAATNRPGSVMHRLVPSLQAAEAWIAELQQPTRPALS